MLWKDFSLVQQASFKLFVSISEMSLSKRLQELAEGNPWESITFEIFIAFRLTSNMVAGVNSSIWDSNLLYPLTRVVLGNVYGVDVMKLKIVAPNFKILQ